jgi:hypothetical protein
MTTAVADHVLGDLCAALERDAAAEEALITLTPRLSDEQILWAWEVLTPVGTLRWRVRSALAHEALQRVGHRADRAGRGTAAVQQLALTLGLTPSQLMRLAQIHEVVAHDLIGPAALAVLPEMNWYEEALAAPDPATALAYAIDQVTSGQLYRPADLRRDVQKVVAARGRSGPAVLPSDQVRLRVRRRDGSLWPAAEAVQFDLGDVAAITVETPQGRMVLTVDRQGHIVATGPSAEDAVPPE